MSKKLWGLLFIIIGIILGLNTLNITNINLFFEGWWTLFIIIPSLINLFDEHQNKTGNLIVLAIGIALLLASRNLIDFEIIFKLAIPFSLVVIGLSFIFSDGIKKTVTEKIKSINKDNLENIIAIFSDQKLNKDEENFKGANLDCVFGGITLDLKNANFEKETIIKASAIFGGIDIILPNDVNVKVNSIPIFGEISNKLRNEKDNKKTIYIDAFCLFGGIDIKWVKPKN